MALAEVPEAAGAGAPTDEHLLTEALSGETGAFEELYRRHVDSAYRVACVVAGNRHDAADAVSEAFARIFQKINAGELDTSVDLHRYLLAATRNAAIDVHRRGARVSTGDDRVETTIDISATPADAVVGAADAALVARAFADLPERWRSVLWLTEVEGLKPADAADQLGLSANNTSQLAHRARQRLRDRYLQAHVAAGDVPESCRFTLEHLGAYVGGGLAARDVAKLDQHLADCSSCRARLAELEDVGSTLRGIVFPLPLALVGTAGALKAAQLASSSALGSATAGGLGAAGATAGAAGATAAGSGAGGFGVSLVSRLDRPPRWLQSATAGAAAALLAAGLTAVVVHDDEGDDVPTVVLGERTQRDASSDVIGDQVDRGAPGADSVALRTAPAGPAAPGPGSGDGGTGTSPPVILDPGVIGPPGGPGTEEPIDPEALAQVGVGGAFGGNTGGVAVGLGDGGSTGAKLGPVAVGAEPPAPADADSDGVADDGLVAETGGSSLPGQSLSFP